MTEATPRDSLPPLPHIVPRLIQALTRDFAEAGFTVAGLAARLGPVATAALHRDNIEPALRSTADPKPGDAAAILVRLFTLGLDVPRDLVDAALPTLGSGGAVELGILRGTGTAASPDAVRGEQAIPGSLDGPGQALLRATFDLRPYAASDAAGEISWWIASDLGESRTGTALDVEHVLGIGGATTTLAATTIRRPVRRALDLGVGSGLQALHVCRHAEHVVGTDVSQRALGLARFNAQVNGAKIDLRPGNLFEPVRGETFDLIVSNPPFVITPRAADIPLYVYRDGGEAGDRLVERIVADVGAQLAPGGIAQLLANWEITDLEDWRTPVEAWLDRASEAGHDLDAWIVQREVQDPAQYAETWIRDGGTHPGDPDYARLQGAWLDGFESRGVVAVGFGMMLLRRPIEGRPTLRRLEDVRSTFDSEPGDYLGGHFDACLAAHDRIARLDAAELAELSPLRSGDVTEVRHYVPGASEPSVIELHQRQGFGRTIQVGTALAALVGAADGDLSAGQLCAAISGLLNADAVALEAELLAEVRDLVLTGMLRFADD